MGIMSQPNRSGEEGKWSSRDTRSMGERNTSKADGSVRVHDFGKPIGSNGETRVKVHMDGKGNIHGYPVQ